MTIVDVPVWTWNSVCLYIEIVIVFWFAETVNTALDIIVIVVKGHMEARFYWTIGVYRIVI
jgi:hypothetical protein